MVKRKTAVEDVSYVPILATTALDERTRSGIGWMYRTAAPTGTRTFFLYAGRVNEVSGLNGQNSKEQVRQLIPAISSRVFRLLEGLPKQADLEEACSKMLLYQNFRALPVRRRWRFSTRFDWHDIEVMTMTSIMTNEGERYISRADAQQLLLHV